MEDSHTMENVEVSKHELDIAIVKSLVVISKGIDLIICAYADVDAKIAKRHANQALVPQDMDDPSY